MNKLELKLYPSIDKALKTISNEDKIVYSLIVDYITENCGINYYTLFADYRASKVSDARHLIRHNLRSKTKLTLKTIGRLTSALPKDHSTVLSSIKRWQNHLDTNDGQCRKIQEELDSQYTSYLKDEANNTIVICKDVGEVITYLKKNHNIRLEIAKDS